MSRKKPNATNFCYFVGNFFRHQLLHRIAIYFEAPCATTRPLPQKLGRRHFIAFACGRREPWSRTSGVVCVVVPVLRFPGAEQQEHNAAERLDAGRYAEYFAPLSARRVLVRQRSDHLHNNNPTSSSATERRATSVEISSTAAQQQVVIKSRTNRTSGVTSLRLTDV